PGHVRLSLRAVPDGQKTLEAMVAMFDKLQDNDKESAQEMRDQVAEVSMLRHLEVITRLDTLQPAWARFELRTTIKQKGTGEVQEQIERHEYTFSWPK
ncbi:MAG: hypothetical protein ACI9SE_004192, partial [Neolewinella sp.]